MSRYLVLVCCVIVAGCTGRGSAYTYDSMTRVALLNATSPSAQYYSFKAVTNEVREYPVNWGVPQLVERSVRFNTPNAFLGYPAPGWLRTMDLLILKSQLGPKGSPSIQKSLAQACAAAEAEALLILGTSEVNWTPESQIPKKTAGYGMFTASGSYVRPYFAYAIVAAAAINCEPLAHVETYVTYGKPQPIEGLEAYIMPDSLKPGVLDRAKNGVLQGLQQPINEASPLSPLLNVSAKVREWFGTPAVIVIN